MWSSSLVLRCCAILTLVNIVWARMLDGVGWALVLGSMTSKGLCRSQ
jgi:hypothetical protein